MGRQITETDKFVFFWDGWPSQWYHSPFDIDGVNYNCCEQYMMAEKARFFMERDKEENSYLLKRIMASDSPKEQKRFGRNIKGFVVSDWDKVCQEVVYRGNLAKFRADPSLRHVLLATGDKTIVEASPVDPVWGIGLSADDPRATDPAQWKGKNWLGIAIMRVRDTLRKEIADAADAALASKAKA